MHYHIYVASYMHAVHAASSCVVVVLANINTNALHIGYVTMIILAIICSSMLFIYIIYYIFFLLFYITSMYTCIINEINNIAVCIYRYENIHTILFLERLQTLQKMRLCKYTKYS